MESYSIVHTSWDARSTLYHIELLDVMLSILPTSHLLSITDTYMPSHLPTY